MAALATFAKTLAVLLGCLAAADIAGVLACTLFDIAPLRHKSDALAYAIWFVLGVFAGLLAYNWAAAWASGSGQSDWSARPGAAAVGTRVLLSGAVILAALCLLFDRLYWSRGVAGEYFVPDSAAHSLVFLGAALAAMLLGRFALMPKAAEKDSHPGEGRDP